MLDERSFFYEFSTDTSMRSPTGALHPAAYLRLIEAASEAHLGRIELDVPRLVRQYGVTWVMLSLTVQLGRQVAPNERLRLQTWATHRKGAVYRRELRIFGEDGETVAEAASFSALLDLKKRRICMDRDVMAQIDLPDGEEILQADSRAAFDVSRFSVVHTRTIRPSWLDVIGHMNNSRYAELAYDALTDEQRGALPELRRMEFYYMGELTYGDRAKVLRNEDGTDVFVAGVREADEKPSFLVKFCF